jgi:hypothetical protein
LIGDGREVQSLSLTLRFDEQTGAWSEAPPREKPLAKTPEREALLRYLLSVAGPQPLNAIAAGAGKLDSTVYDLLNGLIKEGKVVKTTYGK